MTSKEAIQQVDACERQINVIYSKLLDDARSMGSSAEREQSNITTIKWRRQLIISLIGLIVCFASSPVWGSVLIIGGIFLAYFAYCIAGTTEAEVKKQVEYLNNTLDSNLEI